MEVSGGRPIHELPVSSNNISEDINVSDLSLDTKEAMPDRGCENQFQRPGFYSTIFSPTLELSIDTCHIGKIAVTGNRTTCLVHASFDFKCCVLGSYRL